MAIARNTTASTIKPLDASGAIVVRFVAGSAIAAGEIVSLHSDGGVDPSDCTAAADPAHGVAVTAAAAGQNVDVVVFGGIECLTGATIGAAVYNSTTAGEPGASGGNATKVGYALSATALFVNPAY